MYNIEKKDWDILIILDACRYDYFKEVYERYFSGRLEKRKSITSDTEVWVNKMFLNRDCHDIIYITPVICIDIWLPKHNLFCISKSWESNFDYEYGAVMPDGTNSVFYSLISKYPDKRYIIHYGQPHTPFVGLIPEQPRGIEETFSRIKPRISKKILFNLWTKINFPDKLFFYANNFLEIKHKSGQVARTYIDQLYEMFGWEGIQDAYKRNLLYVLDYIKELVDKYPNKRIVITADHGELLGENNIFGHKCKRQKEVTEIPWLEIE